MTTAIAILLAPLFVLTSCFVVEVLAGLKPLPDTPVPPVIGGGAVIVVPAHNEEAILRDRLGALQSAAGEAAQILVVADNCTDSTAEIARSLGVETSERHDVERRGKGFALAFARRHLEHGAPEVVLVIDADCMTDSDSIHHLVATCSATGRPCQATNLQLPAKDHSPAVQLSTFAFFVKNVIRQRGVQRLAGRAHLLGTGMAFPWAIFARANLATDSIVEDLKLGQELADDGHAPLFVERAQIWSGAESERNTLSQRQRWEGGFLSNAIRAAPLLFLRSLRRADLRGVWGAINLMIPPAALLLAVDMSALAIAGPVTWLTGADHWPLLLLTAVTVMAGAALTLAWAAGGRRFATAGALARIPLYLIWKLPLYRSLARNGSPQLWLRTERGEVEKPAGSSGISSQPRVTSPEMPPSASGERP